MRIVDLSYPIINHMPVFPGDEPLQLSQINNLSKDGFNNYRLAAGMHTGTHIDGPMHMIKSGRFINEFPIESFMGTGCLLNASEKNTISHLPEIASIIIPDSFVLIYTGHGNKFGSNEYYSEYPSISMELARLFVELRIKMVCFDTPSPDRPPYEVHKYLLSNSILIAENLANMKKLLEVKKFEVIAFPLRIQADSAPARIVARILE